MKFQEWNADLSLSVFHDDPYIMYNTKKPPTFTPARLHTINRYSSA